MTSRGQYGRWCVRGRGMDEYGYMRNGEIKMVEKENEWDRK